MKKSSSRAASPLAQAEERISNRVRAEKTPHRHVL